MLGVHRKINKADSDRRATFVLELTPEALQEEIIEWFDRHIDR